MKKTLILLAIVSLALFAGATSAFANFGPHGSYSLDTDACAGCHRAHTSFSEVTWKADDGSEGGSALLVSSAKTVEEFCLACHGDQAPGASTNVEAGIFDAGPSGRKGEAAGGSVLYRTNSTFGATLNGGAFLGATSMHDMEKGAATDPMWGYGSSAPSGAGISCTSCHDVHGSSNYRLLKDKVERTTVGGYDNDVPEPFVYSSEEGYPRTSTAAAPNGGWLKHEAGAAQMANYRPNYTEAEYWYGGGTPTSYANQGLRSMSTWCSGCHEQYDNNTSAYDYGEFESNGTASRDADGKLTVSGGTLSIGSRSRHRHPVNTTPGTANTINGFGSDAITSTVLPLEKTARSAGAAGAWDLQDYMGCLTCHRAHGSSVTMTGWASARVKNISGVPSWTVEPTITAVGTEVGVNPNFTSALLRANNRGVCERCHNK